MRPWRRLGAERLQSCRVFDLDRVRFAPPHGGSPRDFYVVEAPDWINVVAVTDDRRVVLVRQFRFGTDSVTLEIPGGMCDGTESPEEAARRELAEETGYVAEDWRFLGWVHPNPAIQSNRCHTYLATGARPGGDPAPDPDESFEVVLEPIDRIPDLVRRGAITHSLVISAIFLWGQVLK